MSRNKNQDLNIIKQAAKLYENNLLNKNILFLYLENNAIKFYETTFLEVHFKHLTGVKTELNAHNFFYKAKNNRMKLSDFDYKDNTTALKLDNLIKAMLLSNYSKMIGEFKHNKLYLSVKNVTGNNNLIIGFDEGKSINYPKTLLKGDIREYTITKPNRIIAILVKNIVDKRYKEITYMAKNITVNRILKNEKLQEIIDEENLFSKTFTIK